MPTISTIINRNYVEKGNLDGNEKNIPNLRYRQTKWREVIKRKYGLIGKLVPLILER
jgi:DNA topoisomerase-1